MLLHDMFKEIEQEIPVFLEIYMEYHPILEDYEREAISEEKYQEIEKKFLELAEKRIREFIAIEPKVTGDVLFSVKQRETRFEEDDSYMHSFVCKREELLQKAYQDFSIWNDEKVRIEHYSYDFSPLNEVLGYEVYFRSKEKTEVLCEIFNKLTFHGLTEESSKERKEEIINDIKASLEDIKEGRTYTVDEVFEKLEEEILEGASKEEKEQIIKDREERKKNKPRDDRYSSMVMLYNHNSCIQTIRSWYLENFKNGNITI